jgi:hypothetical protein
MFCDCDVGEKETQVQTGKKEKTIPGKMRETIV